MAKVLIVVNMQEEFVYGNRSYGDAENVIPYIQNLIEKYRHDGNPIVFTRFSDEFLPMGDSEWNIIPELQTTKKDMIINTKQVGYNMWEKIGNLLPDYEDNVIELCGTFTAESILANAIILKSVYPEANVQIQSLTCASTSDQMHRAALDVMYINGIDIVE